MTHSGHSSASFALRLGLLLLVGILAAGCLGGPHPLPPEGPGGSIGVADDHGHSADAGLASGEAAGSDSAANPPKGGNDASVPCVAIQPDACTDAGCHPISDDDAGALSN